MFLPLFGTVYQRCQPDQMKNNDIVVWCHDKDSKTYKTFLKCQQDCLQAMAGYPNISAQLINWFHTTRIPLIMPIHDYMCH